MVAPFAMLSNRVATFDAAAAQNSSVLTNQKHPSACSRTSPSLYREPEHQHQPVGERAIMQPHQPDRDGATDDLDPGASRQREGPTPIAAQHRGVPLRIS